MRFYCNTRLCFANYQFIITFCFISILWIDYLEQFLLVTLMMLAFMKSFSGACICRKLVVLDTKNITQNRNYLSVLYSLAQLHTRFDRKVYSNARFCYSRSCSDVNAVMSAYLPKMFSTIVRSPC